MTVQMHAGQLHVAQFGQRSGQLIAIGQIGDRNVRPLFGQPSRGSRAAAKVPQTHHGYCLSAKIHEDSRPALAIADKPIAAR